MLLLNFFHSLVAPSSLNSQLTSDVTMIEIEIKICDRIAKLK